MLSPSVGHLSHLSPKPEWLYPGAHEAQIRPRSKYCGAHAEILSARAGSETSPLFCLISNFPLRASFFAPRQAPPNMHGSNVRLRASLGHCDHPNNVRMPDSSMEPKQEPPGGQSSQLPRVALKYSSSLQSEGLTSPRSEQDEEPSRMLSYPDGHASHERLGLVF